MSLSAVSYLLAALFFISALLFSKGKATNLLSVFVMLTPEERKKIDLVKLVREMAPVLFIYTFGFVLMGIFSQLKIVFLYFIAMIVFLYGIGESIKILKKAKESLL